MKKIIPILFVCTSVYAAADKSGVECDPPKTEAISLTKLKVLSEEMKLAELKNIAKKNGDKVVKYFTEYTKKSCSTVSYKFPDFKINPDEAVYFHIPEELRERGVRFMVLGHRQEMQPGWKTGDWDDKPGLSSVQVYTKDNFKFWNGPSSGKNGAKFAEIRSYVELENLYDWNSYGHTDIKTQETSKETLFPEMMKIHSVGKDQVLLSEMTLKVEPYPETSKQEKIFSPGTEFYPMSKGKRYKLGGGQEFEGTFPGAKALHSGQELVLDLEAGKKLTSIDIACGDSHPDKIKNHDGGWGTSGWAKLSVGVKKPNGQITWFMNRENVPPEGMLIASPDECDEKIPAGSKLIIRSTEDTTYIMGVHVGYR